MDKPQKPTEQLPSSFGGIKENFSEDLQSTGYQPDVPDILGGANLNYMLDAVGKNFKYNNTISDFVNGLPINNVISTDENNKLIYKNITDFSGANPDLSNLTSTGEKHFVNKSQITNCLLSIPQLVPQPVVADNTLTFSQGLTVIVPYGKSAPILEVGGSLNGGEIVDISWDGQNLFYVVKYGAKTYTKNKTSNSDEYVLMNAAGALSGLPFDFAFSSATEPEVTEQHAIWYDSTNNIVKWSADTGSSWANYYSLPVAAISFSGSGSSYDISGVKTLYNGTKFIDSALFIDKGIKILIPSGRNPDGTLKNTEYEFTNVGVYDMTDDITGEYWVQAGGNNFVGRLQKTWWKYDFVNNYIVGGNGEIARSAMVGEFSISSGKITSFKPYNAFHAIDYNEAVKRGGDTMSGDLIFKDGANPVIQYSGYPRLVLQNSERLISDGAGQIPSNIGFGQILFIDKNGATTGYYQNSVSKSEDVHYTNFGLNRTVNSVTKQASAGLQITSSGTRNFYATVDNFSINGTTVRYVKQSYINGTSWYRVWSDGWIEQGGRAYVYVSKNDAITTISFLKTFANTNYTPVFTFERYSSEDVNHTDDTIAVINAVNTNSINVLCYDAGGNVYHTYLRWQACGY